MNSSVFGNPKADELTHTKLLFAAATAESIVSTMISGLQRVPGVLLADSPLGCGFVSIAHDAGVPPSALLQAASRAGVEAHIHPVTSTLPFIAPVPRDDMPKWIFGFFGVVIPIIIIFNMRFLQNTENIFRLILLAPLLILYMALIVEHYTKKRGER